MSNPCKRRLLRDFKSMKTDAPKGITGAPNQDNIQKWDAVIFGFAVFFLIFNF